MQLPESSVAQSVLQLLNFAAPFLAALFAVSGILLRSKANTIVAKSEIEVRNEKLRVDFAEMGVQQAMRLDDRLERERKTWKEDVEKLRAENTAGQLESAHYKGQLDIMQKTLSDTATRSADRDLLIGQQTTQLDLYRKEIDGLKAEIVDLRKQLDSVTAALTASNAAGERMKAERDTAVDKLAAQTPATPIAMSPATATPL